MLIVIKRDFRDKFSCGLKNLTVERHKNSSIHFDLPIVEINVALKASSENLNKTQVLPTPESPMSNNLKR